MDTQPDHVTALNKAKIALMRKTDSVFFTTVCFSLKHKWDDSIPTAATNGKEILFNTKFFLSSGEIYSAFTLNESNTSTIDL